MQNPSTFATEHEHRESRAAVMLTLPRTHLTFCCTHLDHREESVRLAQLDQLRPKLDARQPFVFLGDFNSLRRHDYDDSTWAALVRKRADAGIETETKVTEELEGSWGLRDCRTAAKRVTGSINTCVHDCRIDYIWASAAALAGWRVVECTHNVLTRTDGAGGKQEEQDDDSDDDDDELTDHSLVVCVLERVG